MKAKVISTLLSMAFVAVVVYISALLYVKPLHAAGILMFSGVIIEDGSLRPLAQANLNLDTALDATISTPSTTTEDKDNESVSSTTDLDAFTKAMTEKDENISNVVVKDDSVAVRYREPARIFGFIPAEVTVTVEVDEDGTVSVKYPWYAFLAGKNIGNLKPGLQMHIGEILQSATSTATTTTEKLSPQVRAELIKAIHTALKEYRINATSTVSAYQ